MVCKWVANLFDQQVQAGRVRAEQVSAVQAEVSSLMDFYPYPYPYPKPKPKLNPNSNPNPNPNQVSSLMDVYHKTRAMQVRRSKWARITYCFPAMRLITYYSPYCYLTCTRTYYVYLTVTSLLPYCYLTITLLSPYSLTHSLTHCLPHNAARADARVALVLHVLLRLRLGLHRLPRHRRQGAARCARLFRKTAPPAEYGCYRAAACRARVPPSRKGQCGSEGL